MASSFSVLHQLYCFITNCNSHFQLSFNAQKASDLTVLQLEKSSTASWAYWYRSVNKALNKYDCVLAVLSITKSSSDGQLQTFKFMFILPLAKKKNCHEICLSSYFGKSNLAEVEQSTTNASTSDYSLVTDCALSLKAAS